jgi:hypothetical protein
VGIFGRSKRKATPKASTRLVGVAYRPFHDRNVPSASPGYDGYVYKWGLPGEPHVGERVYAPVQGGSDEPAVVIVCDPPCPSGYTRAQLRTIKRSA